MKNKFTLISRLKLPIFCYCLSLNKQTIRMSQTLFPFYLEFILEHTILNTIDWTENNLHLILYWLIFTITMSLCVRNEYGHDIETLHYVIFIIAMGYCVYIYKHFYPKETNYLLIKSIFIVFIILKLLWEVILYTWPYNGLIIPYTELKRLFFFLWPYLDFAEYFIKWERLH